MKAPKRLSSGKYVDLANLTEEDIDLLDINNSLNYIYRFTGHYKDAEPLTVAQHTYLTMILADIIFPKETEVKFDCLLHDMPEAYYGDIATPLKRLFGETYKDYTKNVDKVVYNKLWKIETPFTEEIESKRKVCDLLALDIERRTMWKSQIGKDLWPFTPEDNFSLKEKKDFYDLAKRNRFIDLEKIYGQY